MLIIDGNSIYEIDTMCMQTNKKEIEKYLCYEEEQINLLYKDILKKQKKCKEGSLYRERSGSCNF